MEKLEKLEEALLLFKEKFEKVVLERGALAEEVSTLKEENVRMRRERKDVRNRVGTLVKELEKMEELEKIEL